MRSTAFSCIIVVQMLISRRCRIDLFLFDQIASSVVVCLPSHHLLFASPDTREQSVHDITRSRIITPIHRSCLQSSSLMPLLAESMTSYGMLKSKPCRKDSTQSCFSRSSSLRHCIQATAATSFDTVSLNTCQIKCTERSTRHCRLP